MAPRVHIVCQNWQEDRIIPRMGRFLRERLGWTLSAALDSNADILYLSAYFEAQRLRAWPEVPTAAYFTHREEQPKNNSKARLYDAVAKQVNLRIATCKLYAEPLAKIGPTVQVSPPLERDRFIIAKRPRSKRPIVGFSGFTYSNRRKGEDLVRHILAAPMASRVEWRASGRGWPVPTQRYAWADMPTFYQGLDVLVVTSRVEGVPMPPLEALACGARVVIPRGVGLLDELPDAPGICRYERGDLPSLLEGLQEAAFPSQAIDREALREATARYSVEAWVRDNDMAVANAFGTEDDHAGIDIRSVEPQEVEEVAMAPLVERGTGSRRGIYCVAFGNPARKAALKMMQTAKAHMPDVPIALCAAKKIGPEDVLIVQPDSDVGGRRAKLKAYELAPAEWQAVLYLDADTELVAPIYRFFEWIEDGWEFVICKDPHLMDTMHAFKRGVANLPDLKEVEKKTGTLHAMQWNGGVWAFARNPRVARFFARWQVEWEKYAQRDQGALVRAMYAEPLKMLLLGNEWNTFPRYSKGIATAGLMHYPGAARRWSGMIPGRIDSEAAWAMVRKHEKGKVA
jgi:hypothetical protein